MSWISCTVSCELAKLKLDELAKLECKFDELDKLYLSSMSWLS